jgi:hypothetical protein
LALELAFSDSFQNGETGVFSITYGEGLQLNRRINRRNQLSNRLPAKGAFGQRGPGNRAANGEFAAANLAVPFAQLVLVNRHS